LLRPRHAVLAILIAILLAIFVRQRLQTETHVPSQEVAPTQTITAVPSVTSSTQPSASPKPSPTLTNANTQKERSGKLDFPTLKEVREQVSQDPHQTPQALIQFAKDLSARAEVAKQSQASAQEFFGVLEDCLSSGNDPSETVPIPAQLTCLMTAEEFAKLYPDELSSRLKPLQQNASPELKRIRKALDRF
jgi:hypothetical protein